MTKHLTFAFTSALLLSLSVPANASLTLTAAGISDGFSLTTFASGFPSVSTEGPFGITLASNGNVLVFDTANSTNYVFPDVDGQTAASPLSSVVVPNRGAQGYTNASGHPYGGDGLGHFVELNDDGTVNHILTGVTATPDLGVWTNPVDQHIIATSNVGLIDIDPLANGGNGSFRLITAAGASADGITVSPDGTTVYAATFGNSCIKAYSITTGSQTGNFCGFTYPDGTGVISSTDALNGQVVVNTNVGDIDLLNPVTGTFVAIATGGSRGDFTSADTSNGTLLLDYSDFVARLSCGPDCSIGGPGPGPTPVPEPSSVLLLSGVVAAAFWIKRKRTIHTAKA